METFAKSFEKVIIFSLGVLMMLVILISTVEFGYMILQDIIGLP